MILPSLPDILCIHTACRIAMSHIRYPDARTDRPCWTCEHWGGFTPSGAHAFCVRNDGRQIEAMPERGCAFWVRATGAHDEDRWMNLPVATRCSRWWQSRARKRCCAWWQRTAVRSPIVKRLRKLFQKRYLGNQGNFIHRKPDDSFCLRTIRTGNLHHRKFEMKIYNECELSPLLLKIKFKYK